MHVVVATAFDPSAAVVQEPLTYLKIDVEGFDLFALEGANALLEAVSLIIIEFGPTSRWSSVTHQNDASGLRIMRLLKDKVSVLNC